MMKRLIVIFLVGLMFTVAFADKHTRLTSKSRFALADSVKADSTGDGYANFYGAFAYEDTLEIRGLLRITDRAYENGALGYLDSADSTFKLNNNLTLSENDDGFNTLSFTDSTDMDVASSYDYGISINLKAVPNSNQTGTEGIYGFNLRAETPYANPYDYYILKGLGFVSQHFGYGTVDILHGIAGTASNLGTVGNMKAVEIGCLNYGTVNSFAYGIESYIHNYGYSWANSASQINGNTRVARLRLNNVVNSGSHGNAYIENAWMYFSDLNNTDNDATYEAIIDTFYVFQHESAVNDTIRTYYGLNLPEPTGGGYIGKFIGLYLGDYSGLGTNINWAVYSAGGDWFIEDTLEIRGALRVTSTGLSNGQIAYWNESDSTIKFYTLVGDSIALTDNFDNSSEEDVQSVLEDLDAAITSTANAEDSTVVLSGDTDFITITESPEQTFGIDVTSTVKTLDDGADGEVAVFKSGGGLESGDNLKQGSYDWLTVVEGTDTIPRAALDVGGNISFEALDKPTDAELLAFTLDTTTSSGSLPAGEYHYNVIFYGRDGDGGSVLSSSQPSATLSAPGTITVGNIPTSEDPRVVGRKIFRTEVNGQYFRCYELTTIANNTSTTFVDDGSYSLDTTSETYNRPDESTGILKLGYKDIFSTSLYHGAIGYNSKPQPGSFFFGSYGGYYGNHDGTVGIGYFPFHTSIESTRDAVGIGNTPFRGSKDVTSSIGIGLSNSGGIDAYYMTSVGHQAGNVSSYIGVLRYGQIYGAKSGTTLSAGMDYFNLFGYDVEPFLAADGQLNIQNGIYARDLNQTGNTPDSDAEFGILAYPVDGVALTIGGELNWTTEGEFAELDVGDGLGETITGYAQLNYDSTDFDLNAKDQITLLTQGVDAADIALGAVTSSILADSAVSEPKIQGNAVTSEKILNGTIQSHDVGFTYDASSTNEIQTLTAGYGIWLSPSGNDYEINNTFGSTAGLSETHYAQYYRASQGEGLYVRNAADDGYIGIMIGATAYGVDGAMLGSYGSENPTFTKGILYGYNVNFGDSTIAIDGKRGEIRLGEWKAADIDTTYLSDFVITEGDIGNGLSVTGGHELGLSALTSDWDAGSYQIKSNEIRVNDLGINGEPHADWTVTHTSPRVTFLSSFENDSLHLIPRDELVDGEFHYNGTGGTDGSNSRGWSRESWGVLTNSAWKMGRDVTAYPFYEFHWWIKKDSTEAAEDQMILYEDSLAVNVPLYANSYEIPGDSAGVTITERFVIDYGDTVSTALITLSSNCWIHNVSLYINEVFNSTGLNQIDVGWNGDLTRFFNGADASSITLHRLTDYPDYPRGGKTIYAQYNDGNHDASAGEAWVVINYTKF